MLTTQIKQYILQTTQNHIAVAPHQMFYTFGAGSVIVDIEVDVFYKRVSLTDEISIPLNKRFSYKALCTRGEAYNLTIEQLQTNRCGHSKSEWKPTRMGDYIIKEISINGALIDALPNTLMIKSEQEIDIETIAPLTSAQ